MERLLTRKEIAEALRVTNQSIINYEKQGMPMFSKIPPRYLESECREWLKNRGRDGKR